MLNEKEKLDALANLGIDLSRVQDLDIMMERMPDPTIFSILLVVNRLPLVMVETLMSLARARATMRKNALCRSGSPSPWISMWCRSGS